MAELEGTVAPNGQRPRSWRETRALGAVLLPGLYAWGATVAWPAFSQRSASVPARVGALAALLALIVGLALARSYPTLGRAVGVLAFLGSSAIAWGALGAGLRGTDLDPVRAALGALAWGLFALGWGGFPERARPFDELEPAAPGRLAPRARLPLDIRIGFGALVCCALALPMLAWRVQRPGVALLAHALGLVGAVSLLTVGTRILIARPSSGHPPAPRLWLTLCLLWLALGALLWLL